MRFRMQMGFTDEVVWRRQPMHQVAGWAGFNKTLKEARELKGETPNG